MSIRFEQTIELPHSPETVFAVLEDLSLTPKWLAACRSVEQLLPGPPKVGTMLRLKYDFGVRAGVLDGEITVRIPNERVSYRYFDTAIEAAIDFYLEGIPAGTRLTHVIDVETKTFLAGLASPLIRLQLPKQIAAALDGLRNLLAERAM